MKKFFGGLLLILLAGMIAAGGWFFYTGIQSANEFESHESLSYLVGSVEARQDYVPYDQVASSLYQATIAVEDARFYSHGAVDVLSLMRAAASQFLPFMPKSGGSTITMQVVKNLYGMYHSSPRWKAAEIVLADRLEKLCTKDEILSLYVNIINYGDHYHGINAASNGYYGISPIELNPAQATLLAGIPQSPANLQLSDHFEQAKAKQKVVLDAMVKNKMISQEQADEIYAYPCQPTVFSPYWQTGALVLDPLSQMNQFQPRMPMAALAFRA